MLAGIVTEMTPGHDRHAAPEFNFLTKDFLVFLFVYFYIFGINTICMSPPLVFLFVYFWYKFNLYFVTKNIWPRSSRRSQVHILTPPVTFLPSRFFYPFVSTTLPLTATALWHNKTENMYSQVTTQSHGLMSYQTPQISFKKTYTVFHFIR